jgi:alpha-tubulin suppressor-like RCC1 family protein
MVLGSVVGCTQDDHTPAGPEAAPSAVVSAATAPALAFFQLSAGRNHTCGVTTDNRALCWGYAGIGNGPPNALGDGSANGSMIPVEVAGGLRFKQVSAGFSTTCGVTLSHQAYCWGFNDRGEIGDGTTAYRATPVRVAGGHLFRQIETTFQHTCGVSYPDNKLYCWGWNLDAQLGDGTRTDRLTPAAVASTLAFRQVTTGYDHTCAVTTDDRAFCWGRNKYGQIGDSTTVFRRFKPSRVGRGLSWHQVDAGRDFTCATTTDDHAYCWGDGRSGQLGNNRSAFLFSPQPVAGGLHFTRVTAGAFHACGEAVGKQAYCWGILFSAPTTTTPQRSPLAVGGGLTFAQVSAGEGQSCGKTPESVAYCWGSGLSGELGNGVAANSPTPVPVGRSFVPLADAFIRDGSQVLGGLVVQVLHVPSFEDRGAIEFLLPGLARNITQATLTLPVYASHGPYPFTITVLAYAGDGAVTVADWDRGTPFVYFGYGGEAKVSLDVTAPLQALAASGATFAGFNFRFTVPSTITQNGPFIAFNALEQGSPAELEVVTGGS